VLLGFSFLTLLLFYAINQRMMSPLKPR
jgi:hypothetical protein